jgi:hypothetical protein
MTVNRDPTPASILKSFVLYARDRGESITRVAIEAAA